MHVIKCFKFLISFKSLCFLKTKIQI